MAKQTIFIADIPPITDDGITKLVLDAHQAIVENDIDDRESRIPTAVMIIGLVRRLELAERRSVGWL